MRLRLAILAALAFAGACPAAEPVAGDEPQAKAEGPARAEGPPASEGAAPAQVATPAALPASGAESPPGMLVPPLVQLVPAAPSVASPLLPPLLPPARSEAPPAPAPAQEPAGPPASAASTPALRSGAEVFSRLRRGLSGDACDAGSNSARWRQRYAGHPAVFSRRLQSVLPLVDFVSTEVERAGLPAQFSFIPLVESWYQPGAIGPGGPAGMWQMIGTTAKNHGIHIRPGYDGRLSPVESTRAALSYLKVLDDMFGDWQAIVMAYNAGEGRMQNALRRAGSRTTNAAQRKPHGLSNITYDYVDKLQALSCLVQQPHRQGLQLPVDAKFEPLVPLLMDPRMQTLDQFARAHGKDPDLLRRLNPGFRNGQVVAGVPRLVLSPPGASPAAIEPPAVDDDGIVASVAEVFEAALVPSLPPEVDVPSLVAVVDARPAAADAGAMAEPSAPAPKLTPDPPEPVHEVRAGDTLASIASHYQLPVEQILRANHLDKDAELRPGQRLRLVP